MNEDYYKSLIKEKNQLNEQLRAIKASERQPTAARKKSRSPRTAEFAIDHPPHLQDSESQQVRNRNMFSCMIGHLQRAKNELRQDRGRLLRQQETELKVKIEEQKISDEIHQQHIEYVNVRGT